MKKLLSSRIVSKHHAAVGSAFHLSNTVQHGLVSGATQYNWTGRLFSTKLNYLMMSEEHNEGKHRTQHGRRHHQHDDKKPYQKFFDDIEEQGTAQQNKHSSERNHHRGHRQHNRQHHKQHQNRNNDVEQEVNNMVSKLLSKSTRNEPESKSPQSTESKYKQWKYPSINTTLPESFNFREVNPSVLLSVDEEALKNFREVMTKYVQNNLNFKTKCKVMQYEDLFDIFCRELASKAFSNAAIATLVEEITKFHPENIIRMNSQKGDSLFSNIIDEFLVFDFHAILDLALSHSNFANEVSNWFNEYVRQVFPDDFNLYSEALKTCDMTNPFKFYKKSIPFGRKIIFHMGPTNSGKTHAALQRLSSAENGLYCGPLRLLAQEVFTKMNTRYNCKCNLLTGQERRIIPGANHFACTIEMAELNEIYDVAVIDEIQMISDNQRGSAWTRALLGLQAREVHICGDGSALTIVKNLIFGDNTKSDVSDEIEVVEAENPDHVPTEDETATGENLYHYHQPVAPNKLLHYSKQGISDTLQVIPYTRMKPLEIAKESLKGNVQNIRDFDCVVTFSRNEIYEIKKLIEVNTGIKCCVIYGALPPEVRTEQADLFNDCDIEEDGNRDYSVLVASDAVGMGLNLNIKRVVFYRMTKFDNEKKGVAPLDISLVKQIAGRAGRRGFHEHGEVTTFYENDLPYLQQCMSAPNTEITQAGLFPEWSQVESFVKVYKGKELKDNDGGSGIGIADVLRKFFALSRIHKDFFFCDINQTMDLAEAIDEAGPNLSLKQKFDFVNAPVPGFDRAKEMHIRYVEDFANPNVSTVSLRIDMESVLKLLDKIREKALKSPTAPTNGPPHLNTVSIYLQEALKNIEFYHRMIDLYMWLANKYPLRFDKESAEQAREVLMSEMTESLFNQTEENKKIKSVGLLKQNAPRSFEYMSFKKKNTDSEPIDPSLQGLKRVVIGGKEYLRKNPHQVITKDGKVTRDILDVMVDSMDE